MIAKVAGAIVGGIAGLIFLITYIDVLYMLVWGGWR